jgi:cytoskeletal protein CcmA (bactofilin family)
MFKKDQNDQTPSTQGHTAQAPPARRQAAPSSGASAVIGPSITVKGDVSGDEDLVILGRVQGTVNLAQHNVTVGPSGKVKADVRGKMVIVEGEVEGDLKAQEQIVLRHTARVEGSISAPRVALEDGAVFRGGIEMDSTAKTLKEGPPTKGASAGGNGREKTTETKAETKNVPSSGASVKDLSA